MSNLELGKLKQRFNDMGELWLETAQGGHVARDTPAAEKYSARLRQHLESDLQGTLTSLANYALGRTDYADMNLRRQAVSHMITFGLEHRHADFTIKNATLTALQYLATNMGTAAVTDTAIERIAAFPITEGGDAGQLLHTKRAGLVSELESKTRPPRRNFSVSAQAQVV